MPGIRTTAGITSLGKDKKGRMRWRIRYELPCDPSSGYRRQKSETFYGTKKEAEKRLHELIAEVNKGTFVVPSNLTVGEHMASWLQDYDADHDCKDTVNTAAGMVKNHVIGELGHLKLTDLEPYHIKKLYTKLRRKKSEGGKELSTRTVRYVHVLLKMALKDAVTYNFISYNPASRVKPPKLQQEEVKPLTDPEIERLLDAVKGTEIENETITALGTGLRKGELLRLTWSQVNFSRRTITVINKVDNSRPDAKRASSKRTIPLFPDVARALKAEKERREADKEKAGSLYNDQGLVFANEWGNRLAPSNLRTRHWIPALKEAGLPKNTHFNALRHTFVTTLISKGVDLRKVSHWIGHADPAYTFKQYHHYLPTDLQENEANHLNSLIFGGSDTD